MRLPRNRSFRLLLAGTVVSQLGDWAARLALALLVFERTQSDQMVGFTAALLTIPWLGPGQWLAQKADRFDRRRLLMVCDGTRGLVFVILGFTHFPIPILLALVFFVALIDPVFEANRAAMIADVVAKREYANAIQATHGVNQAAQLAGFGLGGLLATALSPTGALAVNGITFFGSAFLISLIKLKGDGSKRKGVAPSFRQAFQFLATDRISLTAVAATVVTVGLANAVETQVPVYGEVVAGFGGIGIGLLAALIPLATLIIIWGLDNSGKDIELLRRGVLLALVSAVPASGLLWLGFDQVSVFVGFACVGGIFVLSTTGNIVAGRRIPAEIRVGTFAVLQASVYVGIGVGSFLGGIVSERTSPQAAAGWAMALCVVVCLVALFVLSRMENAEATAQAGMDAKKAERSAPISG